MSKRNIVKLGMAGVTLAITTLSSISASAVGVPGLALGLHRAHWHGDCCHRIGHWRGDRWIAGAVVAGAAIGLATRANENRTMYYAPAPTVIYPSAPPPVVTTTVITTNSYQTRYVGSTY
jgi:hypothetical protein